MPNTITATPERMTATPAAERTPKPIGEVEAEERLSPAKLRQNPEAIRQQFFLSAIPNPNRNEKVVTGPDPLIVGSTAHVIGRDDHILGKTLRPGKGRRG